MDTPGERWLRFGQAEFDPLSGELRMPGHQARLRPRSASLLAHLVRNPDRVVGKDELMQAVWPDAVVTEDSLVQCVKEARRALGPEGRHWIRTVPRRGYAFACQGQPAPATVRRRRWALVVALALALVVALGAGRLTLPKRVAPAPPLSLVVLPLANQSGDPSHDRAMDELTEDLTAALSRMSGTTVIAPSTAFTYRGDAVDVRRVGTELGVRYVIEGSLRRTAGTLGLAVRLADAGAARQLWSGDFAAESAILGLREEIVTQLAAALGLGLIRAEARRSPHPVDADPSASDLVSRARAVLRGSAPGSAGTRDALGLLEDAVRRDPELPEAWIWLARAYRSGGDLRFSPQREQHLQRATEAADRALALAPDSADAHGAKAWSLYNQGRMEQALAGFERAIELNPNDVAWHAYSAAAKIMLGRPDDAVPVLERAMRLSPRDPELPLWQLFHGVADLHAGRDAAAIDWLTRAVDANPASGLARLFLAGALGAAGRTDEAQAQMTAFRTRRPDFTLSRFRALEPSDTPAFLAQRERLYEGLRRAGMPE